MQAGIDKFGNRNVCPALYVPRLLAQEPSYAVSEEHFFHAVAQGHGFSVEEMIDYGINVNATNIAGNTPAIVAAEYLQIETLFVLLERGHADLSIANKCGFTVMHALAQHGRFDVMEMLGVWYGAPADEQCWDGATPLHLAARNGHAEACKVLVETLHVDAMKTDKEGRTALYYATWSKNENLVRILLDAMRTNPQMQAENASLVLPIAAAFGLTMLVKDLVDTYNAEVNARDQRYQNSALMLAANHGHIDIVRLLHERHADVNLRNTMGSTAAILAICEGHVHIIRYFLGRKLRKFIDLKARNIWNFTALDYAYLCQSNELVNLLTHGVHRESLITSNNNHATRARPRGKKTLIRAYNSRTYTNLSVGNLPYMQMTSSHWATL